MSDVPEDEPEIVVEPAQLAGVYANRAAVPYGGREFTLDFVRLDSTAPPPGRGILVARVSVSAALVIELIDHLEAAWQRYAEDSIPPEFYGQE